MKIDPMEHDPITVPLKITKNSDKFCCGECGESFDNLGAIIVHLNDTERYSFEQIAGSIEDHNVPIEKINLGENGDIFPDIENNYMSEFLAQNDIGVVSGQGIPKTKSECPGETLEEFIDGKDNG